MVTARLARCIAAALVITAVRGASAQTADAEWGALKDRNVVVEKQDGGNVEGKLVGLENGTLELQVDGRSITIERAEVKAVRARVAEAKPLPPLGPPLDKMLGRQTLVVTKDQKLTGKLVELTDDNVVVELDGGERVTVPRAAIMVVQKRFPDASTAAPSPSGTAAEDPASLPDSKPRLLPNYVGAVFRPWICLANCDGVVFTSGVEAGTRYVGIGLRFGFRDGGTFVSPDLRLSYEWRLSPAFNVMLASEISPMFGFGGGATLFQLVERAALRLGFAPSPKLNFFIEPLAFDVGTLSAVFYGGRSQVTTMVVARYVLGTGLQYRF